MLGKRDFSIRNQYYKSHKILIEKWFNRGITGKPLLENHCICNHLSVLLPYGHGSLSIWLHQVHKLGSTTENTNLATWLKHVYMLNSLCSRCWLSLSQSRTCVWNTGTMLSSSSVTLRWKIIGWNIFEIIHTFQNFEIWPYCVHNVVDLCKVLTVLTSGCFKSQKQSCVQSFVRTFWVTFRLVLLQNQCTQYNITFLQVTQF